MPSPQIAPVREGFRPEEFGPSGSSDPPCILGRVPGYKTGSHRPLAGSRRVNPKPSTRVQRWPRTRPRAFRCATPLLLLLLFSVPLRAGAATPPDSTLAAVSETTAAPPPFRFELMDGRGDAFDERGREIPDDERWRLPSEDDERDRGLALELDLDSMLRYNRVEGLAVSAGLERDLLRGSMLPAYRADFAYAFAARRGQYRILIEQPLLPRHKLTLGATAYRRNDTFFYGDEIISGGENSMSALLLHRDYRDWFETDGGSVWLGVYPSPFLAAHVGVTSRRERSLPVETDWSILRQTARFRPNPEIVEGTYRAYTADLSFDTLPARRPDRRGVEHRHRLSWERSDESLDGDFDSWLAVLDSRTYLRLSPSQSLALRMVWGSGASASETSASGTLPPQRRFVIGGIGTLRGHDFQSLAGDRMALANLEYDFGLVGASRAVVFVDAGSAWDEGTLFDQRIDVDMGAGVRLGEKGVSFYLARNVNRSDSDAKVLVRFQSTF